MTKNGSDLRIALHKPTLLSRYTYYTELNTDKAKVFQANEGQVHFRRPFPILKERTKRDQNKNCRYTTWDMTPMIVMNLKMR